MFSLSNKLKKITLFYRLLICVSCTKLTDYINLMDYKIPLLSLYKYNEIRPNPQMSFKKGYNIIEKL